MYKSVMDVLDREHTLVRLDNPFNSEYPEPIPRNHGRLLDSATALKLAVDNEMPPLEDGPSASALWL